MKRLYSLLFVALAFLIGFAASAQSSFTFKVNEPSKVSVSIDGNPVTLTGETTVINFVQYQGVSVNCETGWNIRKFTNSSGAPLTHYGNSTYFNPENDATYIMEVYDLDDDRTATCTVTVDDASKVRAMRDGSYSEVPLTNGTQTVKFNPETEKNLLISSTGGSPIYQVDLDGTSVSGSYGSFSVPLSQGCNVNIQANFPEGDADVTFTYGDKAEGFWTGATVNGTAVANFDGKKFTAALGSQIMITGNTTDYACDKITVNGDAQSYFYGTLSFTLTANTEVHVDAHPYGTVSFTLNIDDPANVTVYKGDPYANNPITGLVPGANALSISENNTTINIVANPGCFITSVKDEQGNMLGNQINVTEGMVINIISGAITLDKTAVVWIDNVAAASNYFNCVLEMGAERKQYNLVSGYNMVQFCEQFNDLNIGWYGATVDLLYQNQQLKDPQYQGSNAYLVELAENDIVKIFLAAGPEDVKVNFTADGKPEATVKRDILTEIADWNGLNDRVFAGTEYTIQGGDIKVKVNGTDLEADAADGIFKLTTDSETKEYNVVISAVDGISGITADGENADDAVYNMQGIRVGRRADFGTLPAGLYITGGEKVMKQ